MFILSMHPLPMGRLILMCTFKDKSFIWKWYSCGGGSSTLLFLIIHFKMFPNMCVGHSGCLVIFLLFENFIIQKSFEQIYSLSFPFSVSPTSHSPSCFMCSTYKPTECCLHVQEQGLPTGGQAACQWSHALRKLDFLPPVPTNCHTDHLGL